MFISLLLLLLILFVFVSEVPVMHILYTILCSDSKCVDFHFFCGEAILSRSLYDVMRACQLFGFETFLTRLFWPFCVYLHEPAQEGVS